MASMAASTCVVVVGDIFARASEPRDLLRNNLIVSNSCMGTHFVPAQKVYVSFYRFSAVLDY